MIKLYTDTDTDITLEEAKKLGIELISMPYTIDEKETYPYEDYEEFDSKAFYNILRKGVVPKTSAISPMKYINYFEKEFKEGNDILYVHFSRAMSGTFNAMDLAYEELQEKYPDRKLYTIDTKGITILSYIILKEISKMYHEGKNINDILAWAEKEVDHFATYFFSDNLNFFRKSGRVGNISAVMGNLIGIKPIIYMNPEGTMSNIGKERGRGNALRKLVAYFDELNVDMYDHEIIIGHTDNIDLAHTLGEMLLKKYGDKLNINYVVVNPTTGSHCGPDTVGIAFYAKHK